MNQTLHLKNNVPANGDLHLPTSGQALLESDSDCMQLIRSFGVTL
ncbi:hypothetical protein [Paenibacillus polymyxa]|nr:hypothetical protein [Paenibacillus polymyxa]